MNIKEIALKLLAKEYPGMRKENQTFMVEFAEALIAELAKYSDAPVVVWRTHPFNYGIGHDGVYASTHFKEQSEVWKRKSWRVEEFIVKPGENK